MAKPLGKQMTDLQAEIVELRQLIAADREAMRQMAREIFHLRQNQGQFVTANDLVTMMRTTHVRQ